MQSLTIICRTGSGEFLCRELRALGYEPHELADTAYEVAGGMADAILLNMSLRTAGRVLMRVASFEAPVPDALYNEAVGIGWADIVPPNGYVSVTSSVSNEAIRDTRFANQRLKDAIVDSIRRTTGIRPDSGPLRDRTVVHLDWKGSRASVYVDTSGAPLYKRGYRAESVKAPMQETLAASLLIASGWEPGQNLVNPMCGSGTIAIEAALMATGRLPGLLRDNFGFMHLRGYDRAVYEAVRQEALALVESGLPGGSRIIATDSSMEALEAARINARAAGVAGVIEFHQTGYEATPMPKGGGLVILNPAYGQRMGDEEALESVYGGIGDFFKKRCKGYTGAVFTGNMGLAKKVGLRTSRRLTFFNGPIESRLLLYDLYEGRREGAGPPCCLT